MVQLMLAFCFGSAAMLLLIYGVARLTQGDGTLSPARRALMVGGAWGMVAFLCLVAWWAWVAPPR